MTASHTHLRIYRYRGCSNVQASMEIQKPVRMKRLYNLLSIFPWQGPEPAICWQHFNVSRDGKLFINATLIWGDWPLVCRLLFICTWNWLGQCQNSSSPPPLQHKSRLQRQQQLKCLDQKPWRWRKSPGFSPVMSSLLLLLLLLLLPPLLPPHFGWHCNYWMCRYTQPVFSSLEWELQRLEHDLPSPRPLNWILPHL